MKCVQCGAAPPARAKFCPECGAALNGAPAPVAPEAAGAHPPRHLAERILHSKFALEGERKQVTVMFADLKGSLEILAGVDPEEARALLDPVLERMIAAVHRYEGTVNQIMGDGIMALFGAPLAHEDHALRACYSALAMHAAIASYADQLQPRVRGVAPRIRIGLNSGEVVVRAIRNDLHMDYSAVGQTTHLAARMEQLAEPGSTFITDSTWRLVDGFVRVRSLGPQPVKGYETAVAIHALADALPAASRLQVAASRGLTRFTGRAGEMATLDAALERVQSGRGEVVAIEGEAGVGKSRLLREFAHSPHTTGWMTLDVDAHSYGEASPLRPISDLLRSFFHIDAGDPAHGIRERIDAGLASLDDTAAAERLTPLLALLDVPAQDDAWAQLEPRAQRRRVLEASRWLFERQSRRQPLVLAIEQLHGIDDETQAFLDDLVDALPVARILLVVTFRAEYRHGWNAKDWFTQIRLQPLSPHSATELLAALLGDAPDLDALKTRLLEHTGCNPFFVEESVRTLVEAGVLQGSRGAYRLMAPTATLQMPATVQAILASRIDRLAPDDKQLLQAASVIGKDVPHDLLQAIAELPEERLHRGLANLQAAEFLIPAGLFPQLRYTFKQALTHEVAHSMLLIEQRRRLHREVALWYEQAQGDDLTSHLARLAFHWEGAEVPARAADYLEREAVRLFSMGLPRQSVEVGLHAARLLGVELPLAPEAIRQQIGAQMQQIGQHMAGRTPGDLVDLPALQSPEIERVLSLLLRIGPFAFQGQQIDLYALLSLTCMRLTLEHGNGTQAPMVYSMYSVVHRAITADRVGASAFSTLALELDRRQGGGLLAQTGFVHGWFHNHWVQPLATSLPLTRQAWEQGLACGDIVFACFNLSSYVIYLAALGRPLAEVMDTARAHLLQNGGRVRNAAFHLVHELQFAKALAGLTVQPLALTDAEYDEARDVASICATDLGNQIGYYLVSRVKLHAWFGDWAGALEWAGRARALLPAFEGQVAEIDLCQFAALAALARAQDVPPAEAAPLIDAARDAASTLRAWATACPANFAHKAALVEAVLAGVKGEPDAAQRHVQAAAQAEAGRFIQDAALAREFEARLHRRHGDVAAARAALDAAIALHRRWGAGAKVAQLQDDY